MRILFLLKSHEYSGAESVVLNLMQLLPAEFDAYYASPDGSIKDVVRKNGQNFIPLRKANLKSVSEVVKQVQPDIIHASDFSMSVLAAFGTSSIPILSHLHNNPSWIQNKYDPRTILYRFALKRIYKVVCVSPAIIEEFAGSALHEKGVVIPNVVNGDKVLASANRSIQSDICFVGRLTEEKNPLFFCSVIKEVKKRNPNIKAIMLGRGELEENIRNYISTNKLTNNISLIGFKQNPYPYMKGAKVCIMPSKYEGFGLSAVEMLTLGTPVVAANVGGLKNIINDTCGYLMTDYDAEEYALKYFEIVNDSKLYLAKSNGAINTSKKFTDSEKFKDQFVNIYKEITEWQH